MCQGRAWVQADFLFQEEKAKRLALVPPTPGRFASNFPPHHPCPPTANTTGPETWGGRLRSHANGSKLYFSCFPSVLGLQGPLGIMSQCRGEHGGACGPSQREGLQIGDILLFSPFHSENFPKREI